MITNFYIFYQVIFLAFFIFSFYKKNPFFWIITIAIGAIPLFSSYNIEIISNNIIVYTNTTNTTITPQLITTTVQYPFLFYLNLAFIAVSIIYLLVDIFNMYKDREDYNQ